MLRKQKWGEVVTSKIYAKENTTIFRRKMTLEKSVEMQE